MVNSSSRYTANQMARAIRIERALRSVEQLRADAIAIEQEYTDLLNQIPPILRESAYNLLHYLAVRRHDLRQLQHELSLLGLSSLGRMEAHVMATLKAVLDNLYTLSGQPLPSHPVQDPAISLEVGRALLEEHALAILGPTAPGHSVRVMVTLPSEAIDDPTIIANLLERGMDVMRINCAHDSAAGWAAMIHHLRQAEQRLGKQCRIAFDLAGPKLRTGPIALGAAVRKWGPRRNPLGQVIAPALVWLVPTDRAAGRAADHGVALPVEPAFLAQIQPGDDLHLVDTRGRQRWLRVVEGGEAGYRCECDRTAYVTPGLELTLHRSQAIVAHSAIGDFPGKPQPLVLKPGDILRILRGTFPATLPSLDEAGIEVEPARVSCSLPEVFQDVQPGERIFFDDGKIAGVIINVEEDAFSVKITSALNGQAKLRGEKGINLPDTDLKLPALSAKDRQDLQFIAQHADMVALSFVQRPSDIEAVIAALQALGATDLGIVLKIENQRAFNNLPQLLLTAMQHPPVAVMVARGDLGVELGFERLSEVQEEILWLCEAAHVPVIWATQVLESLAKGGMPSRAEVTDAAMASRAECVMLNKGPYIYQTLAFLFDVLYRMQAHQQKKTAMLRQLSISSPPTLE